MPDTEIERLAGDGLEPTPQFVESLREQLRAEWHGDTALVAAAPQRRSWAVAVGMLVVAVAVAVMIVLLALRGTGNGTIVVVDSTAPTVPSTTPSTTPSTAVASGITAGLPASAIEQLWVITSVDGDPVNGPDMPTFVPHGDGTITGWDGCNRYELDAQGGASTVAGCPDGVTAIVGGGPFTVVGAGEVRTSRFTAVEFDDPAVAARPAPRLNHVYRFGEQDSFELRAGGTMTIQQNACDLDVGGTWSADPNFLRIDLRVSVDCAGLDPTFQAWLESLDGVDTLFAVHGGEAAGLWTRSVDRVTRMSVVPTLDGVPAAATDVQWVVIEVGGVTYLPTHDIPSFTIDARGQVNGFDGCTYYTLEVEGPENCSGIQQVRVTGGPFELSPDGRFRAGSIVAVPFVPPTPTPAGAVVGNWGFDTTNSIVLQADGHFVAGSADCADSGTYVDVDGSLQLELQTPRRCPGSTEFEQWVGTLAAAAGAVDAELHTVDGASELWVTSLAGEVTRLPRR